MHSTMNQTDQNVSAEDLRALLQDKYDGKMPSDEKGRKEYEADVKRLAAGEPLAYVIGWVPFLGLRIYLSPDSSLASEASKSRHALIPRPETEWWTEKLITYLREKFGDESFELLDLCAGSGAIGLAVLHAFPNAFVSLGEINPEHVQTIDRNIRENNLDDERVVMEAGDLFTPFEDTQFDIIVSNPPYIPEAREIEKSVTLYEPAQALYSGADGLDLIRHILADAPLYLLPQGELWIECDTENIEEAKSIAERAGYSDVHIHLDQYGRVRLLVGHFE
jgi:release factor glutamine methyltransferase